MKHTVLFVVILVATFSTYSQALHSNSVSMKIGVAILKAEDSRRYDPVVFDKILKDPDPETRSRAALAAGRIGDDAALAALTLLLQNDDSEKVRAMAAFAIGEIESDKGTQPILKELHSEHTYPEVRARAVEAAGKIAAANPKDAAAKQLGEAILDTLRAENELGVKQDRETVLLGLTAALRVHSETADVVVAAFLTNADPEIRATAANTMGRIHGKNANTALKAMLLTDSDALARAGGRALGSAKDKSSLEILLKTATTDRDPRVRIAAIRSLDSLMDGTVADGLLGRGQKLLADCKSSKLRNPSEKSEILEIATSLGTLLTGSSNEKALEFLTEFRAWDKTHSPEIEIALAQIAPQNYVEIFQSSTDWRSLSAQYQGLAAIAKTDTSKYPAAKLKARLILVQEIGTRFILRPNDPTVPSRPDLIRAFAAFRSKNSSDIFRSLIETESDVFVRAALAEVLGDEPSSTDTVAILKTAFSRSLIFDKQYDDAQLAILDALFKLDKKESVGTLLVALGARDYLVRKKAFEMLDDQEVQNEFPGIPTSLESARSRHADTVLPYSPAFGTKLGQLLNTDADYRRALSRKNGSVKAILTTDKGSFTIDLLPDDAPLTVDNFIKLANARYFDGVEVHRVVPNFVMQDGDPRGDGNGGPGWSIRCEINMVPYDRGAVGMALSGKDTGGSQWFVTHSPQPHLDGGYTVFGKVNESDMKLVDNIVRGDKILTVRIVDASSAAK